MAKQLKRQGSNNPSFTFQQVRPPPRPTADGEINVHNYLSKLNIPRGLRGRVLSVYRSLESRIWVLDNSTLMQETDCCLAMMDDKLELMKREEGASRWSEQIQCAEFHMKMAARCCIPTKFWLTNKPKDEAQRFATCWGDPRNWTDQRQSCAQTIKDLQPVCIANPLANEIRRIVTRLEPEKARLMSKGKFVSVVVCTQGVPTDENGLNSSEVMEEYIRSLFALSDLPVKIVFRLSTSDRNVLNFYKKADLDIIDCDVLGDYWKEAMEVHQHNPWLTYGIGLHRLREAGLATDIMDYLDERPLTLHELYEWCMNMFAGNSRLVTICHPAEDWCGFVSDLSRLLIDETRVFDPIKREMSPWIDVDALQVMYGPTTEKLRSKEVKKKSPDDRTQRVAHSFNNVNTVLKMPSVPSSLFQEESKSINVQQVQQLRQHESSPPSREKLQRRKSEISGTMPRSCTDHLLHGRRSSTITSTLPRKSTHSQKNASWTKLEVSGINRVSVSSGQPASIKSKLNVRQSQSSPNLRSFRRSVSGNTPSIPINTRRQPNPVLSESFRASVDPPPSNIPSIRSRRPYVLSNNSQEALKTSAVMKYQLHKSLFGFEGSKCTEENIVSLVKEWAYEGTKLRPLQVLLFELPVLLPPENPKIDYHEYFSKWKILHREDFKDAKGAVDDQVVSKIAKKCKLFLHPDKWSQDLSDDQKLLLQAIWDVFQESALF